MSTLKVDKIVSDIDFTNNIKSQGHKAKYEFYSAASEPSTLDNGTWWWDTANSSLYLKVYGKTKKVENVLWENLKFQGNTAVVVGGWTGSDSNVMQSFSIQTTGNATDFGDLRAGGQQYNCSSNRVNGLIAASASSTFTNNIDYIVVATPSNTSDWGDLGGAESVYTLSAAHGDGSNVFWMGGKNTSNSNADYIQVVSAVTPGNAADFGGNLTVSRQRPRGAGSNTRAIAFGGNTIQKTIDYITMATVSNAVDFGDLDVYNFLGDATSNDERSLYAGGRNSSTNTQVNTITYVVNATTSNAIDFGDLTVAKEQIAGCANSSRATFSGGTPTGSSSVRVNAIEYVTISTLGNGTDFGDLLATTNAPGALSGN